MRGPVAEVVRAPLLQGRECRFDSGRGLPVVIRNHVKFSCQLYVLSDQSCVGEPLSPHPAEDFSNRLESVAWADGLSEGELVAVPV